MAWVVDTCLLLDVLDDDPVFGESSAKCIECYQHDGLTICPVSMIELAPAFLGDWRRAGEFMKELGIDPREGWTFADTQLAFSAWHRHIELKRAGKVGRRPVADIQIGAFAMRHQGLLTRNARDFSRWFPALKIP